MNREGITKIVIEAIVSIQKLNGRSYEGIGLKTKPLEDLDEFDSLNAFEVVVKISEIIGKEIDIGVFGIQPNQKSHNVISIDDIINNILDKIS